MELMFTLVEPVLAHAKFYEELATACPDEKMAMEFLRYSQRCREVASAATALGQWAQTITLIS